nr:hypothetical protein Iba_chr01fCG10020 [Ipomoea batatas]
MENRHRPPLKPKRKVTFSASIAISAGIGGPQGGSQLQGSEDRSTQDLLDLHNTKAKEATRTQAQVVNIMGGNGEGEQADIPAMAERRDSPPVYGNVSMRPNAVDKT